jgi:hypothetical protein
MCRNALNITSEMINRRKNHGTPSNENALLHPPKGKW